MAGTQVFFQLPLWNRNQGTREQALADLVRQEGEVRRVELRLRQELAREYRRYLTARQHAENFQGVVLPEARKAYETLLKSYEARRAAWPEVLDAERNYFQLRDQYYRHLVEWREAEVLIRGFLLHGGLQAPPRPTPPGHIDAVAQPR